MADDAAISALVTLTALVTAFRLVGQRYLTKILEETDVRRLEGQLHPGDAVDELEELERYRVFAVWLPIALWTIALGMFLVLAGSYASEPRATWPLLTLAAVLLVWLGSTWFVQRRCAAFCEDLDLIKTELDVRSGRTLDGGLD